MRRTGWIFFGIIILLLIAVYTDLPNSGGFHILGLDRNVTVQQGLDLKGGVRVLLCAKKSATSSQMSSARDVIENRASGFSGLSAPQISVVSGNCIDAELPGVKNQNQAIALIGQTGKLVLGGTNIQSGSGTRQSAGHPLRRGKKSSSSRRVLPTPPPILRRSRLLSRERMWYQTAPISPSIPPASRSSTTV